MTLVVQRQDTQETLTLALQPFASGGEGELYAVTAPKAYMDFVVKIYHAPKRDAAHRAKLEYLLSHPPAARHTASYDLVWPVATVAAQGQFVGYLMPRAEGQKLEVLCALQLPRGLGEDWQHFARDHRDHLQARIGVGAALSAALQALHAMHRYVLVDIKPDNILVQSDGRIAIVDMDSMQVADATGAYHLARVATPEYAPPEYFQGTRPMEVTIFESWDRYSLAVILYKVLCGIHPFAGTAHTPFDQYVNLQDKILHGLFVHAPIPEVGMRVVPPPHRIFHELPASLQQLWVRAFNYGHQQPDERPTAQEWSWQLTAPADDHALRPLPSSRIQPSASAMPAVWLPSSGVLTAADVPRPRPAPTYLPQPRPFAQSTQTRRLVTTLGGGLTLASIVVLKGAALVSGLGIAVALTLGGLRLAYGWDEAVRHRQRLRQKLERVGRDRRKQRRKVLSRIQELQRFPRVRQALIPVLQAEQEALRERHRAALQEQLLRFKQRLRHWDREVITLNRSLIDRLQALNKRLSANLWSEVDAAIGQGIPRGVRSMPLPQLVQWLDALPQEAQGDALEAAALPDAAKAEIRRKAQPLLEAYHAEEAALLEAQEATYRRAMEEAERARVAYEEAAQTLKQRTTATLEAAMQQMMADAAQSMRRYLELQAIVRDELAALEALYVRHDELVAESLPYRELSFSKYIKSIV